MSIVGAAHSYGVSPSGGFHLPFHNCFGVNKVCVRHFLVLCTFIFLLPALRTQSAGAEGGAAPGASGAPQAAPAVRTEAAAEPFADQNWAGKTVAVPVEGAIVGPPFSSMPELVTKALDKADADGAALIVLEIDSPGGEVGVCDALAKRIFESKTPVVSLVLHKAVSGAAMIASAAPRIAMTRTARIGDIQPMQMSLTGAQNQMDERTAEKIEVDIRTIMKVYAHQHGRPAAVMEAMVSRASSLYQVHFRGAETEYLTGEELELLEENIKRGRERRRIADTKIIKAEGKLLELSAPQALDYGIADEVVDGKAAFYAARDIAEEDIVRPEIAPGEMDLKKLLPSMEDLGLPVWVVLLLAVFLVVGIAGFVTEYHAPGSGIPMAAGIIGFVCFFATLLMHDRGSPLGIALFIAGIILLIVEIMILPGFGVAGILGILGILAGLFLAFTPAWGSEYMQEFLWQEVGAFTLLLGAGLVAAITVIYFISRHGENLPVVGHFFLTADSPPNAANAYQTEVERSPRDPERLASASLRGAAGVAETMLRPAGKVRLDSGEYLDVVTEGVFIEAGSRVAVTEAAPGRIVVAPEKTA